MGTKRPAGCRPGPMGEDLSFGASRPPAHLGLVRPTGLLAPLPALWCCARTRAESSKAQPRTGVTGEEPTQPHQLSSLHTCPQTPKLHCAHCGLFREVGVLGPNEPFVQGPGLPHPPTCQGGHRPGRECPLSTLPLGGHPHWPGALCPLRWRQYVPLNSRQCSQHPATQPLPSPLWAPHPTYTHFAQQELQKLAFICF